jgi:hypothetical protein
MASPVLPSNRSSMSGVPAAAAPATIATKNESPNNARCTPRRPSRPGRKGAAASANAGSAGRTYTPRLPGLMLKKSTTRTIQPSSSHGLPSRPRQASRQRGHSHGSNSVPGSHRAGMTWTMK